MSTEVDALAVKIVLLRLVNDLPERPTINELPSMVEDQCRVLPIRHESSITQHFAFLSAYSDDPVHATAVCIEESRCALVIRVAVNSGTHEMLRGGLERIVDILRHHACDCKADPVGVDTRFVFNEAPLQGVTNVDYWRSDVREVLLQTVVKVNYWRILTRLRSRHMKSRKSERKVSLLQRLNAAVKILQISSQSLRLAGLVREVQLLQEDFDRLEEMEVPEVPLPAVETCLMRMIKRIHRLVSQYRDELMGIPRRKTWTGDSTEALFDRLKKLGQYVVACEELLTAARRYALFDGVRLEWVDGLQVQVNSWDAAGDMEGVVDGVCGGRVVSGDVVDVVGSRMLVGGVCSERVVSEGAAHSSEAVKSRMPVDGVYGEQLVSADATDAVKSRMRRMTSFLHAEMQLALFYEQNKELLPPRVICASKSACYLCNLFLRVQRKYVIPSCHGKVYDAWVWPVGFPGLLPLVDAEVDQQIQRALASPRRGKRVEPRESTVDLVRAITPVSG